MENQTLYLDLTKCSKTVFFEAIKLEKFPVYFTHRFIHDFLTGVSRSTFS